MITQVTVSTTRHASAQALMLFTNLYWLTFTASSVITCMLGQQGGTGRYFRILPLHRPFLGKGGGEQILSLRVCNTDVPPLMWLGLMGSIKYYA